MSLEVLEQKVSEGIVRSVDTVRGGHTRIQTQLVYPDGSFIDVFVRNGAQQTIAPNIVLSDLGQTTSWLLDMRLKPWLSENRKRFIEDALDVLSVRQNAGALEIELSPGDPLNSAILRLAQACLRVSDLVFTQRNSVTTVFKERVEEFFSVHDLPFDQDVEIVGRHGRPIRVDYRVAKGPRGALVLALGPASASSAHTLTNEIFRRWYELNMPTIGERRVTIYDDACQDYREDDLALVRDFSELVPIGNEDAVAEALAA
jgi:hypothetical protein